MSLLILFIIAVFLLVYAVKVSRRNKEESEKQKTAEQPTHLDLLDDNGNPIPLSDDRYQASVSHSIHEPSIQRLSYFCIKNKGYHVSVWPKDQGFQGIDYIEFNIAGMPHRDNINEYLGEFKGTLEAEPQNAYDSNAIKVLAPDGHHVGYVPKDITSEIRNNSTLPCPCFCYIGENDGVYFSDCYILRPNVSPK